MHKVSIFIVLIASAWACNGCMRNSAAIIEDTTTAKPERKIIIIEESIKERTLHETKVEAEPLNMVRSIESKGGEGGRIVNPISLVVSVEGGVYVSDNSAHLIHYYSPTFDSVTTLPAHAKGSKLIWPTTIQSWQDFILVTDNDGIKVFKCDGSFQRLLRTYYHINHFTTHTNGAIYANPLFRTPKASDPLIIELSREGARVKGFGTRLNRSGHAGLDDEAYLCATAEYVLAIFRHRPVVQIYSIHGKLIREFTVSHPIFSDLAALYEDEQFVHPAPGKFRLPTFIAGAKVMGDRLLVLLALPRPEIIEFDFQGQEIQRYRGDVLPGVKTWPWRGFDVRLVGDIYQFYMFVRNGASFLALMQFTAFKKR